MIEVVQALWETELRLLVAPAVALAGVALVLHGLRGMGRALRLPSETIGKNLRLARGLRSFIMGLVALGFGTGWALQVEALAVAAVIIGLGELFETSLDIWALRREVEAGSTLPQP
jgi:hypothetical protein